MDKMKARILIFAVTITSLAGLAAAQSPNKVLKQATVALGGKSLQNQSSVVRSGTIRRVDNGASGRYLMQVSKPNLYHLLYDLDGFETEAGFIGKSGWYRDSGTGLRTLTGKPSLDFQAEAGYRSNLWLNYKKERARAASCGRTAINGKTADCVLLTGAKGVSVKIHFDTATSLPIREERPFGDDLQILDYGDYRAVNGIREAFSIDLSVGEIRYEIRLAEVRHNASVDRSDFDFPASSGEPLPEIPTLLKELQANEDRVENMLENYSFTQKVTRREVGKDGVLRETGSETSQLSFYKG